GRRRRFVARRAGSRRPRPGARSRAGRAFAAAATPAARGPTRRRPRDRRGGDTPRRSARPTWRAPSGRDREIEAVALAMHQDQEGLAGRVPLEGTLQRVHAGHGLMIDFHDDVAAGEAGALGPAAGLSLPGAPAA